MLTQEAKVALNRLTDEPQANRCRTVSTILLLASAPRNDPRPPKMLAPRSAPSELAGCRRAEDFADGAE